jgi:atypical dual specificity phosphatase
MYRGYFPNLHDNCYCASFESAQEIVPGLFVGNWCSTKEIALKKRNITRVLSMLDGYAIEFPPEFGITHKQIFVNDEARVLATSIPDYPSESKASHIPYPYLQECMEFIHSGLEKGENVLVHCMCGMNRSVSTVACYLMWKKLHQSQVLEWEQAIAHIESIRHCICPYPAMQAKVTRFIESERRKKETVAE